jgi:hypothetical protein
VPGKSYTLKWLSEMVLPGLFGRSKDYKVNRSAAGRYGGEIESLRRLVFLLSKIVVHYIAISISMLSAVYKLS